MTLVARAIAHIGLNPLARRYGYAKSAIHRWKKSGRLPQSELCGLTDYAMAIEELSKGLFKREDLLSETRAAWARNPRQRGRAGGKSLPVHEE